MYASIITLLWVLLSLTATPGWAATPSTCTSTETYRQRFGSNQIEICNGTNWKNATIEPSAVLHPLGSCSSSQLGQQRFVNSTQQMQYCDGSKWIKIGCAVDNTDTTCNSTLAGKVKQDITHNVLKFCNGQNWIYMTSIPGLPCCPDGYIPVPANPASGTYQDFCVAKYHMKAFRVTDQTNINGKNLGPQDTSVYKPESRASNLPWSGINLSTAQNLCASLGSRTHLITNAEWMTVAHSIENNINNWSGGAIGVGHIPTGHSDGDVNCAPSDPTNCWGQSGQDYLEASANDSNGCYGTNNPNCLNKSHDDYWQKRTFQLSNGQIIWDMAGNLNSWVNTGGLHSSARDTPAPRSIYQLNDSGPVDYPGPMQIYPTMTPPLFPEPTLNQSNNYKAFLPSNNYGNAWYDQLGFGLIRLEIVNNWAVFRGGKFDEPRAQHYGDTDPDAYYRHFKQNAEAERRGGIYSAWLFPATSNWDNLGFRCVYDPN